MEPRHLLADELDYEMTIRNIETEDPQCMQRLLHRIEGIKSDIAGIRASIGNTSTNDFLNTNIVDIADEADLAGAVGSIGHNHRVV